MAVLGAHAECRVENVGDAPFCTIHARDGVTTAWLAAGRDRGGQWHGAKIFLAAVTKWVAAQTTMKMAVR